MYATFHIKAIELDENFLKTLKKIFGNKNLSITVEEELDETEYLLSTPENRHMLEESIISEYGYEFSSEEFIKLSKELKNGKRTDFSKLRKVKLPK
jgi:16S rRNA A1518/A1519 N6-dimethyltransferase RsmA/KsgA/DIM1 with predicted DNA glycosylase/AP lyase activity